MLSSARRQFLTGLVTQESLLEARAKKGRGLDFFLSAASVWDGLEALRAPIIARVRQTIQYWHRTIEEDGVDLAVAFPSSGDRENLVAEYILPGVPREYRKDKLFLELALRDAEDHTELRLLAEPEYIGTISGEIGVSLEGFISFEAALEEVPNGKAKIAAMLPAAKRHWSTLEEIFEAVANNSRSMLSGYGTKGLWLDRHAVEEMLTRHLHPDDSDFVSLATGLAVVFSFVGNTHWDVIAYAKEWLHAKVF